MGEQHAIEPKATGIFTVPAEAYGRQAISMLAEKWWWVPALPITLAAIIGLSDWRWLVVAMAMLFVAFPVIAMFAWFSLLTRPDAISGLYPHSITLRPDGTIETTYYPMPQKDEETTAGQPPAGNSITPGTLRRCHIESGRLIIEYNDKPSRILIIPLSAFPTQKAARSFFLAVDSIITNPSALQQ